MKANIHGVEIEGTVEEIVKLINMFIESKKLPPATTLPNYPNTMPPYYPHPNTVYCGTLAVSGKQYSTNQTYS